MEPNSGIGWELYKNYLIAREKFKPNYFLYENNQSAATAIKNEIANTLGVNLLNIDSALVSAQSRKRFYGINWDCTMPEDRGILLKDILDSGIVDREKSYCLKHQAGNTRDYFKKHHTQIVFEPIRIGTIDNQAKRQDFDNQQYRVYSPFGKSVTLCGNGGGLGAKTGLYAVPVPENLVALACDKGIVYMVRDKTIATKFGLFNIDLPDGNYIIRKLSVNECKRLQTVPDWYKFYCSDTQSYKMLGNGWTVEVIKHLISQIPNIHNEVVEVLSMYDGMSCAMIALRELGIKVKKYYATEIDKYCIENSMKNFPEIIHMGDAFNVRNNDWRI